MIESRISGASETKEIVVENCTGILIYISSLHSTTDEIARRSPGFNNGKSTIDPKCNAICRVMEIDLVLQTEGLFSDA